MSETAYQQLVERTNQIVQAVNYFSEAAASSQAQIAEIKAQVKQLRTTVLCCLTGLFFVTAMGFWNSVQFNSRVVKPGISRAANR